jgi:hypothetical protein
VTEEESEQVQPEETQHEESKCYVVPEKVKPLVECCKKFEEGEIDEGTFFAEALVKTGEFMKAVKQSKTPP